jgi:hypothetical protein
VLLRLPYLALTSVFTFIRLLPMTPRRHHDPPTRITPPVRGHQDAERRHPSHGTNNGRAARRDIPIGTLRAIEKDMEPIFGQGWLR